MDLWKPYRPKDERLRLAILKEKKAYRDFWTKHSRETDMDAFNSGLWHFGIRPYTGTEQQRFLNLIDPFSKEPLPGPLPFVVFRDVPSIVLIETKDIPIAEHRVSTPRIELEPSERLLKVDLARPRGELLEEFKLLLDKVDYLRTSEDISERSKQNYSQWERDNSRLRAEAWQALEVWKLRREKMPFKDIAYKLKMSEAAAKKAFCRAYELIEEKPYKKDQFTRRAIPKSELKRTCDACPDYPTCGGLCPDMIAVLAQLEVKANPKVIYLPDLPF